MNKLVGISNFVKRQTKDSQFTHFDGTWDELDDLINRLWRNDEFIKITEGYRAGVILASLDLVSIDPFKFYTYTDFPMFDGMKLEAEWGKTPGREHEPSKLQIKIKEQKKACKFVDIVLYSIDVLKEDNDEVTGADWDVVSINGRLNDEPAPMDPLTIVRNWKHLPGGTEMKGSTAEEVLDMLCESILYENGIKK